jgi:hypothetical protein
VAVVGERLGEIIRDFGSFGDFDQGAGQLVLGGDFFFLIFDDYFGKVSEIF